MIIALIFSTLLATLALGAHSSMEATVAVAHDDADSVRAELAVDAALQYSRNQLMNDPYWQGTGDDWIDVADRSRFHIAIDLIEDDQLAGVEVSVRAEGRSGNATRALRMNMVVSTGSDMSDMAVVFLSSDIDMKSASINGEALIPDAVGAVLDYRLDAFGAPTWTENSDELGVISIVGSHANQGVYQYTSNNYFGGNTDIIPRETPFKMPAWNLDGYLDPASGYWVEHGITELSGINTDMTVVVILAAGETLTVSDCQLHGGLVVWAPPDYDLRSGPRNTVVLDSCNIGTGSAPHIGLLAPAAAVTDPGQQGGGDSSNFHGLNFWNSIQGLGHAHMTGAVVVVNEVVDFEHAVINRHPPTMGNLPDGIMFSGDNPGIDLVASGEDYGLDYGSN